MSPAEARSRTAIGEGGGGRDMSGVTWIGFELRLKLGLETVRARRGLRPGLEELEAATTRLRNWLRIGFIGYNGGVGIRSVTCP